MPPTPTPRPHHRPARALALGATLAVGLVAVGAAPAQADPFAPAYPTVYISQSNGSSTTLKQAAQSRLANAGAGGVTIADVRTVSSAYNALGFRVADGYAYAVSSDRYLVRIAHDGSTTRLGPISGISEAQYSGAFGDGAHSDAFFVRPTNATSHIYSVDVDTRVAQRIDLSGSVNLNDFTWAHGYLWGVEAATKSVVRIDVEDGTVTRRATAGVFPTEDPAAASPGYGAAWTYGNGNIAVSNNESGRITQFRVVDPAGAFTVEKVSTIVGPSTSQNDATTTPSTAADLTLAVTPPTPAAPSAPIAWQITVGNSGPGGSSGAVVQFPVPAGVTGVGLPSGCTQTAGVVQCVTDPVPAGATDTFAFTGTAPGTGAVSATSTVTVIGNELDPTPTTATLTVEPSPSELASTGTGTAPQSVSVPVPGDGVLTLLDADGDPTPGIVVPGQGTYAVAASTLTFTPVLGFAGPATPAGFRVTTPGGTASGTYTPTVLLPAGPTAPDLVSTGTSPSAQTASPDVPTGGTLTLLDSGGTPATTVPVPGQGSYTLAGEVITFVPLPLWTGTATPAIFRVTDAYGQWDDGTYTPTVQAPAPPAAPRQASTGVATAQHEVTLPVPSGGAVTLLDAGGDPTTTVTVAGVGRYTLEPTTGVVTFEPELGYQGSPTPQAYRVTDAYGQVTDGEYAPSVLPPAPPAADDVASSGPVRTPQQAGVVVPVGGSVTLLDADGDPASTVTVAGVGTYTVDPGTGTVAFSPASGFAGLPPAVGYRVVDAYGQSAQGSYQPEVVPPPAPALDPAATSGRGTTPHTVTIPVPAGAQVVLLDADGDPATAVTLPGVGTFTLDPATGAVVFEPVLGFVGSGEVGVRLTDEYGQSTDATYTAAVTAPAAPPAPTLASQGPAGTQQSPTAAVPVPAGGSVTLVDGEGRTVPTVVVPGQGTYRLDDDGRLVFTPAAGFSGTASPVTYRVTDAYGQSTEGTYTAVVAAPPALAATGATVGYAVVLAGGLLLAGVLLVLAGRRRRSA